MTRSQSKQVVELGFKPNVSASTLPSGGVRGPRNGRPRLLPAQMPWREHSFVSCIGREPNLDMKRGAGLQDPECPGSMPSS